MKNHKYFAFLFLVIAFGAGLVFLMVSGVQAKAVPKYPILELGNCQNKVACYEYCDASAHYLACTDFGEQNDLITEAEAARAKKLIEVLRGKGPGGCKDETVCKDYCNKMENQKECFVFSMKNGLISAEKLKEIEAGIGEMRSGLKQMPSEMRSCIIGKVGAGAIDKIEAGQGEPIDLIEIGGAAQNCAISYRDALMEKQAPSGMPGCIKSVIGTISGKTKSGGSIGQSDIMSAIIQNCLPKGTNIPPGALEMMANPKDFQKKMEDLRKMQEQNQNVIPQGIEVPSGEGSLDSEDAASPEIPGDDSGMGM